MITFLKGIVVGLGAIAPGLSGSILLVLFGLYQRIVSTVSRIFHDFKRNILFLLPLALGIGVGILLFSKLISIPLEAFPMQTHYAFLGLILGTVPMLLREVRRDGFSPKYYLFMGAAFLLGGTFFFFSRGMFPNIEEPSFLQSVLLGLAVACAYLIPGVDSCAILSSFGMYELWLDSINHLEFGVLLPAAIGLAIGGILISLLFNQLLSRWYTGTYSVVFGLFIAVIFNFVYRECPLPRADLATVLAFLFLLLGLAFSLAFGNAERILAYLKKRRGETCENGKEPS